MRPILRIPLIALLTIVLAFSGVTAASAHNVLESTAPQDGASVSTVPHRVVLTFDQPSESIGTTIAVKGPDGPATVSKAKLVNNTVAVVVGGKLPAGSYTVNWRVTSADGHPVSGSFDFTAKKATTYEAPASPASGTTGKSGSSDRDNGSQDASTPSTSQSSGSLGTILIVIGVALIVVIIIVIAVVTLRRRRYSD
ncbi:copper resistance CopC family protein [Spelaeicoccus albus]|uniref:CopC domain-containing protein n=1 Tax=Spelaeicoccus albus TaxID=1280376 RepID=A0A7Z0A8A1_9MICO|nr:copper resistance CopC family protein [Spelaeicoccus albus]NYI66259.1 hypothetical protein [Spelaeicoccus albus]